MRRRRVWCLLAVISSLVTAQNISDATLSLVQQRLTEGATHSWELGTRTQALLEFTASQYSVFNQAGAPNIPPPSQVPSGLNSSLATVFDIARTVVNGRNTSLLLPDDALPLFTNDTSAGDPASMGVAVLLANWTSAGGATFDAAATQELNYLLNNAPRTSDGAISHRKEQVQLWSDSVFMVPPFIAYYGAMTNNETLLTEAYNQCKLYRSTLQDTNKSADGLWTHIALGNGTDAGHWSTGNGWAAMGMLRVYATIAASQFSNPLKGNKNDLADWVEEILDGMYTHVDSASGFFHNYADDTTSFLDGASTALVAAATYRNVLLTGQQHHVPDAEKARKAIASVTNGNTDHFDANGWLTPVVNPDNVGVQGSQSPEGQAFVLMMQSAYDDWVKAGSPGVNAAMRALPGAAVWIPVLLLVVFGYTV